MPAQLVETPRGPNVWYQGRFCYSERAPEQTALRLVASLARAPARLYVIASPLLGYGLSELAAQVSDDSAILCIEANTELAELTQSVLPSEILTHSKLKFILAREHNLSAAEIFSQVQHIFGAGLVKFRQAVLVKISGGEFFAREIYQSLTDYLNSEFDANWKNRVSLMAMGNLWARNIFDNLAQLTQLHITQPPTFTKPLVVCGAGPSLENSLTLLSTLREKIQIVCADSALPVLLSAGIFPDLVLCLEGQAHNLADFTQLAGRPIYFCGDLSSHPASFRIVQGPKMLTSVRITNSEFLTRLTNFFAQQRIPLLAVPPLGSVGVHALFVALELSKAPVFITGLDFAFEVGKTHARSSPNLQAQEKKLSRLNVWNTQYAIAFRAQSKNILHSALITDPNLHSYSVTCRQLIAQAMSAKKNAIYDLRTAGLPLGLTQCTLQEAEKIINAYSCSEVAAVCNLHNSTTYTAQEFIHGEMNLLDKLHQVLRGTSERAGDLVKLLNEVDYLFWNFPDAHRSDAPSQDFLNRIVASLAYWRARLAAIVK